MVNCFSTPKKLNVPSGVAHVVYDFSNCEDIERIFIQYNNTENVFRGCS
jgi:hypothetical protein